MSQAGIKSAGGGGGGNVVLIQSQTAAPSFSISFTNGINATYNTYMLVCTDILLGGGTDVTDLQLLLSNDGGASYVDFGYISAIGGISTTAGTYLVLDQTINTYWPLSAFQGSFTPGLSSTTFLYSLTSGDLPSYVSNGTYPGSPDGPVNGGTCVSQAGGNATTTNINALRVQFGVGIMASGTISLFGILE